MGTLGAIIRIKEPILSRKQFFDIGIMGPLSGFIVALGILWYGFTHLPPQEYIFKIHPEYRSYGLEYSKYVYDQVTSVVIGSNLLLDFFIHFIANPAKMPHTYELIHYPLIMAGYFGCYFTALNLIPIGQLDGGHILYGLLGYNRSKKISLILFISFLFFGGLGLPPFYQSLNSLLIGTGIYIAFLFFSLQKVIKRKLAVITVALGIFSVQLFLYSFFENIKGFPLLLILAFFLGRFLGVYHPKAFIDKPLSLGRKILGWIALCIFIICFSLEPLKIIQS